jgi:CO dehydrogenase nickel-insertion accessory protein CooC1
MGRDIGIKRFGAILNKVTDAGQVEIIRAALPKGVEFLGSMPYSPALQQADLEGRAVFGVDDRVEAALADAKRKLESLIAADARV